jgi:hypothetical protein
MVVPTSQSVDLKSQLSMAEHIKVTPIYESNPPDSEENPTYCVSKVVGVIVEEIPQEPSEDIPRYIVSQETTTTGGSGGDHNEPPQRPDSDAVESTITEYIP